MKIAIFFKKAPGNIPPYIKIRVPEKLSRKSLGVQLFFFLKIRLKLEMLLNPQW